MSRFMYSALRFVPDPLKGEFVNVGVIAGSDEEEQWSIRSVQRTGRATGLMATGSHAWQAVSSQIAGFQAAVDDFGRRAEGLRAGHSEDQISEAWLARLVPDHQNMLQFSQPMPVMGSSVDDVIDQIWSVLIDEPGTRRSSMKKSTMRASMAKSLLDAVEPRGGRVAKNGMLVTDDTHADIDIVTHNGSLAQLTQCYSFDVSDLGALLESVKAWGWTIRDLRDRGGTVKVGSRVIQVPRDVRLDVVYFVPDEDYSRQALREAQTVFNDDDVDATSFERSDTETIVEAAMSMFGGH